MRSHDGAGQTRENAISCEVIELPSHLMRQLPKSLQLDAIDRGILNELQNDGRLSNVELAQRVHLSPSACLRRVKQLEDTGVIAGYVALLNPKLIGQSGVSFTIINLATMSNALLEAFEDAVR